MRFLLWAIVVSLSLPPSNAQQQHSVTPEALIDGAKQPELISDTTAYRLFLSALSGRDK
jgi:hypothetical protein